MKSKESSKLHPFLFFLLMTAFGLLLVMRSELSWEVVVRILGAVFTVGGLIYIISYITGTGGGDAYLRLFGGILVLGGGFFILIKPGMLAEIFPKAMGIIILLNGFLNLTRGLDYLKTKLPAWKSSLLFSVITMALGLGILFKLFPSSEMLLKILGVIFIYDAVTSLWIHTRRPRRKPRAQDGSANS